GTSRCARLLGVLGDEGGGHQPHEEPGARARRPHDPGELHRARWERDTGHRRRPPPAHALAATRSRRRHRRRRRLPRQRPRTVRNRNHHPRGRRQSGCRRMAADGGRELHDVRFGIALGALNSHFHVDATDEAERLGYESVWLPEHLVLPVRMSRSPHPGDEHPPVPPTTPVFDAFAYLDYLAGRTRDVRLGTHVYNLGLRHPFVSARAVQTLDVVSNGRLEFGVGASWLEEEWRAQWRVLASRGPAAPTARRRSERPSPSAARVGRA